MCDSPAPDDQVERNSESTDRQYALVERAVELGWPRRAVEVIDEDLGLSGSGAAERGGFARLTADVALGRVGIVFGLEVSRLARNNADWYRLLDLPVSPTPSSPTPTASTIQPASTTVWCWA